MRAGLAALLVRPARAGRGDQSGPNGWLSRRGLRPPPLPPAPIAPPMSAPSRPQGRVWGRQPGGIRSTCQLTLASPWRRPATRVVAPAASPRAPALYTLASIGSWRPAPTAASAPPPPPVRRLIGLAARPRLRRRDGHGNARRREHPRRTARRLWPQADPSLPLSFVPSAASLRLRACTNPQRLT